MARQLVFDLAREPRYDADDFLVSPANAAAVEAVRAWPQWPDRTLLLVGPAGAGKSHLGAVWAAATGAAMLRDGGALTPSLWDGGERAVLLENGDRAGYREPDLFHALNLVRETRGWLLVTARTLPGSWGIGTPDLLSRMRLAPAVAIMPPDENLLRAALVKMFADRQIAVEPEVVVFAARNCDRSLDAARRFVAAVDEAALSQGRRVTRPLAAATLLALSESVGDQGPT